LPRPSKSEVAHFKNSPILTALGELLILAILVVLVIAGGAVLFAVTRNP
jgi:hypothetical protein